LKNVNGSWDVQAGKWKKRQQWFVIKFFWLREHRHRPIHQELFATLESDACSEDSVQYWVACFESGDISCEDISRAGRRLTDLAELFRLFLQDYPFVSSRMLSRHFGVCVTTVKDYLARDLFEKMHSTMVPHTLSGQKK
jgi:hypothetical protein